MDNNIDISRYASFTLLILVAIFLPVFIFTHSDYKKEVNTLSKHRSVTDIMSSDSELKQELYEYVNELEQDTGMYDTVNLNTEPAGYLEWIKTGNIRLGISSIDENTETFKSDSIEVYSEIRGNNKVYIIGDLVFKGKDNFNLKENTKTEIEIHYAKDEKENNMIEDYTVVYQK